MLRIYNLILLSIFIAMPFVSANAQKLDLKIYAKEKINQIIIDSLTPAKKFKSKLEIYSFINSISNELSLKGFINNTYIYNEIDTVTICYFTLNKKINVVRVFYGHEQLDPNFIKSISVRYSNHYFEVPVSEISKTLNLITNHFESKGFSFSIVSLKNLRSRDSIIESELNLSISSKRTINSVVIKGYENFPKKYIKHYLNINSKTSFNSNTLLKIQRISNEIPFISQIKNPEVLFTKDSTSLFIYFKKKSVSSFDGLIGLSTEQKNNKLKLNGYLNLLLNNIFDKGEEFGLNWRNNGNGITTLKLNIAIPYILQSKFSTYANFGIYKNDSLYTNTINQLKVNYNIKRNQSFGVILNFENSNTLNSLELNEIVAFNKKHIGFSYSYIDAKIEKENELNFGLHYLLGSKKYEHNNDNEQQATFNMEYLIKLNKKSNILLKNKSEILTSSKLFENELFRIGGVNSIKGFDELSILTSKHIITNLEYQFYTNNTDYVYTISDYAFIENQFSETKNNLFGIGLGYSLKSNNSIINIGYAVGKTNNQSFQLKNAKLHIKIASFF